VSKTFKPGRSAVELRSPEGPRPSRIRRDPPGRVPDKSVRADPSEYEYWVVAIGVTLFAIAITIIILGISDYTSK